MTHAEETASFNKKFGKPRRMIGRCRACLRGVQVMAVFCGGGFFTDAGEQHQRRATCKCGNTVQVQPVVGKVNKSKPCSAKCLSATGGSCECACGGANHGGGL